MPKILTITIAHLVLAITSGYLLGMSVFAVGFAESARVHHAYAVLVVVWEILNAPAGVYLLRSTLPNWPLWLVLQLFTSFLWANALMLVVFAFKRRRRVPAA